MRKESRINPYFPRQFQDCLKTVSSIDKNLSDDKRYQTRIKMGLQGLELHKKLRGTYRWEKVTLPDNLPPVDLSSRPSTPESFSPPPGRPRLGSTSRDKRGRESSSSESEQNDPKVTKQVDNTDVEVVEKTATEKAFRESVQNANLVSEVATSPVLSKGSKVIPDPGSFTNIQGTPVKSCSANFIFDSPIHSRSKIIKK